MAARTVLARRLREVADRLDPKPQPTVIPPSSMASVNTEDLRRQMKRMTAMGMFQ